MEVEGYQNTVYCQELFTICADTIENSSNASTTESMVAIIDSLLGKTSVNAGECDCH